MKTQVYLFGTQKQAQNYANSNDLKTDTKPISIGLRDAQSMEGAPDTYSGETNALLARDINDEVVAYLAFWE